MATLKKIGIWVLEAIVLYGLFYFFFSKSFNSKDLVLAFLIVIVGNLTIKYLFK